LNEASTVNMIVENDKMTFLFEFYTEALGHFKESFTLNTLFILDGVLLTKRIFLFHFFLSPTFLPPSCVQNSTLPRTLTNWGWLRQVAIHRLT